jgi:hypothetical protein
VVVEADLIAAGEPPLAQLKAEVEAGVPLIEPERLHHLLRPVEEAF